jgi:luciferase family oxidoreductase group 1
MTSPPLRLSVLDQSPISEGSTAANALRNTIDLARLADELGYHRYWVAEHHGGGLVAGSSPEALIGPIAAATSRLRVGSGGVMLPYYSALHVAETFGVLNGLFPGRIDLGVGRAPGADSRTALALLRDRSRHFGEDFPQQLAELGAQLRNGVASDGAPPELWLLGSSTDSAIWAAEQGLPYAFADFINPDGAGLATLYRERFTPSLELPQPRIAVAVTAICAETDEEAELLATSSRMAFTLLRQGRPIPVPPVETALRFFERYPATPARRRAIVGAPETVRATIEEVAASYGAEEAIVVAIVYEHGARKRSYELIADAFGLERARYLPPNA